MKVIRLSAVRTGRPYSQRMSLVLISVRGGVDPRAIVRPEIIMLMKNSNNPIGESNLPPSFLLHSTSDNCHPLFLYIKVTQMFKIHRSYLKVLGVRWVKLKFHTEDPQILGVRKQNLVSRDLCTPGLHYFSIR